MIKLFHAWSSCSLAPYIALTEAGAHFEVAVMDTKLGDQRQAEYLAINPKGRVPALVTDRGVLTENVAILAWIAQAYPDAGLMPTEPWAFAQAQAFHSYLAATVHVAHAHRHRGYRWADTEAAFADMTAKTPQNMAACFRLIEDELIGAPWVLGEAYSVCDAYLFTIAAWLAVDGVDVTRFPKVARHQARMRARPAVRKVLAEQAS